MRTNCFICTCFAMVCFIFAPAEGKPIPHLSEHLRTEWSPIRSVIIRAVKKSAAEVRLFITSMITDRLDHTKSYYPLIIKITISEKRGIAKLWKKAKFALKDWQRGRKLFNVALKLRWIDLNCNFECDWLIELSNNELPDNNLSNNLFLKPITM